MKNYKIKIQEEDNFCLCSVLQAIFKKHEIYFSQIEIAKNLTPSEKGFFADDFRIKNFLNNNKFNYEFYFYDKTPFNEPDMLLREMDKHHGIIGIKNHVYLLNEFQDPILQIINPKDNKIIKNNIYLIRREMQEEDGFFGLLEYICFS
jgi:hypothetical protein